MNRCSLVLTLVMLASHLSSAADARQLHKFRGEIADTQCANNVHSLSRSHKEMLATRSMGTSDADCTRYCVRRGGGDYVLHSGSRVYSLAKSDSFEPYAGQQVIILGRLDPKTKTITAESVKAK